MRLLPVPARLRVYASSDASHNESIRNWCRTRVSNRCSRGNKNAGPNQRPKNGLGTTWSQDRTFG